MPVWEKVVVSSVKVVAVWVQRKEAVVGPKEGAEPSVSAFDLLGSDHSLTPNEQRLSAAKRRVK